MGPALACPMTEPIHVRMEQGRAGDMEANLARYDLVSIRLAVVCAETGSLSEAARLLHMSLSNASHRLSSLEEALGHALFTRRWRALVPTAAGLAVARGGRAILTQVDALRRELIAFEGEADGRPYR